MKKILCRLFSVISGLSSLFFYFAVVAGILDKKLTGTAFISILIACLLISILLTILTYCLWTMKSPKSAWLKLKTVEKRKNKTETKVLTAWQVTALHKVSSRILKDSIVELSEVKELQQWLIRYPASEFDVRTAALFHAVELALKDGKLDDNEELELFAMLSEFCDACEKQTVESQPPVVEVTKRKKERLETKGSTSDRIVIGDDYNMDYLDSKGNFSTRSIRINKIGTNASGDEYISALCFSVNGHRTFRIDRIKSLYNQDTGEVVI